MQVLVKVLEQEFSDNDINKAYLKACKWYASKFIFNEKTPNTRVEYKIDKDENKVKAIVSTSFDINEIQDRHCKVCKELHSKVFENDYYNCNSCNLIAYQNKLKETGRRKRTYYRDIFFNKLRNV